MLKIEQLQINSAIIHRLDNQQENNAGLDLSDLELKMDDELRTVLETHTTSGLEDGRIRYANFLDKDINKVLSKSYEILDNKENMFIPGSKILARLLFASMANKTISAADVVVCLAICNGIEYICLLKLDYKDNYISEATTTDQGRYIGIKKLGSGWPQLGTKLQKAAFIKRTSEDYELIILDRQKSKTAQTDVSLFFQKTFLNVELIDDSKTNTTGFIKAVKSFNKTAAITSEKKKAILDNAINLVVNTENINIRQFVESQFSEELPEDERNLYMDSLIAEFEKNGVKRAEFVKSQDIAQLYAKKRKVFLSGITLEIDPAVYDDKDKFEMIPRTDEITGEEVADIMIKGLKIKKMD
ncbi:nucleoid-associated protein [Brevibacillus laterosporus]|uniref:Nucleoid-associated protein n=1 Tax=Brevibacillus laterosporus TaxID=1465 RepID=A0AAP3DIM5_BRELA|nr:nucleoid-associated protein [Brevibacillus laterosporus]MCR8981999.1 nucleoid-associated protein [Brevibacillus laterosporus]MCZ0809154.1 nucleoid-associated protein [Brevibacillus laterosporus]MCZ0828294.1 nucleoid-associated protein [Brevibacillus laterosporus]MCZ0852606.1 nucleoid-associated protein [Brevibacillus laterosporus]